MNPRVVKNPVPLLITELGNTLPSDAWVWLSAATDPYQPIENETHLTSEILKILVQRRIVTKILTKSERVYNDEDTIIRHNDLVTVGFTITTLDDELARKWEPNASLIHDRMKALRYFYANGVNVWMSGEPLLDDRPDLILDKLEDIAKDQARSYWIFGKDNYMKRPLPYREMRDRILNWFQERGLTNYLIKRELWEVN